MVSRLLLAEANAESVVEFSQTITLQDSSYTLADSRDLLTKENLKKGRNKLWPDNKETGEDNEKEARMAENVREVAHLCQSIRGFEDCDEYDTAEWLDIDRNAWASKFSVTLLTPCKCLKVKVTVKVKTTLQMTSLKPAPLPLRMLKHLQYWRQ